MTRHLSNAPEPLPYIRWRPKAKGIHQQRETPKRTPKGEHQMDTLSTPTKRTPKGDTNKGRTPKGDTKGRTKGADQRGRPKEMTKERTKKKTKVRENKGEKTGIGAALDLCPGREG